MTCFSDMASCIFAWFVDLTNSVLHRDALRVINGSLRSLQRDLALGQRAEQGRRHRERLHRLCPESQVPEQQLLDGPGETRPAGTRRHNNDFVSYRPALLLLLACIG